MFSDTALKKMREALAAPRGTGPYGMRRAEKRSAFANRYRLSRSICISESAGLRLHDGWSSTGGKRTAARAIIETRRSSFFAEPRQLLSLMHDQASGTSNGSRAPAA